MVDTSSPESMPPRNDEPSGEVLPGLSADQLIAATGAPAGVDQMNVNSNKEQKMGIPSALELFKGDINDAVIQVQKITGVEITPQWWGEKVGNEGSAQEILGRFDAAYAELVASKQ